MIGNFSIKRHEIQHYYCGNKTVMKTPKPGGLPPPIPKDAGIVKPAALTMTERTRFAQISCMDYDARFGDRGEFSGPARPNASVPYISLVLPEIILKAGSLAELENWDRTCKNMIADFVAWKLGRHSDYVFGVLAPLIRKVKSVDELQKWDGQIKTMIEDYKNRGLALSWCYILRVMPELIDRSRNPSELRIWDLEIKGLITLLGADNDFCLRLLIPKLLSKAQTVPAFRQWFVTASAILSRSPEFKDDLLIMIESASSPQGLEAMARSFGG
jgi:hypothetical protein